MPERNLKAGDIVMFVKHPTINSDFIGTVAKIVSVGGDSQWSKSYYIEMLTPVYRRGTLIHQPGKQFGLTYTDCKNYLAPLQSNHILAKKLGGS